MWYLSRCFLPMWYLSDSLIFVPFMVHDGDMPAAVTSLAGVMQWYP